MFELLYRNPKKPLTITGHHFLVVSLTITKPEEPVARLVKQFVVKIFPPRMRQSTNSVQAGSWPHARQEIFVSESLVNDNTFRGSPGHKPVIEPSLLLYHERQWPENTV